MRKKLLCLSIVICSIISCCAQAIPYSQGQVMFSIGDNHLTQSSWKPYQDQFLVGISYLWKNVDRKMIGDVGFSLSFDFNTCDTCGSASSSDMTYDGDVIDLHLGLGKWWRKEKVSYFLTGGGFGAFSEYTEYIKQPSSIVYDVENSSRTHIGIYFRSGVDFEVNQRGVRLGPFLESRISTGQTKNNLYLNVNSIVMGIYLGFRR